MHEEMLIVATDATEKPEPTERRTKLVSEWQAKLKQAEGFHDKAFKQMKRDMDAALNGLTMKPGAKTSMLPTSYSATFSSGQLLCTQRTLKLWPSGGSAEHQIWDGKPETLMTAYQASQQAAQANLPVPAEASAIIQDFQVAERQNKMLDNVAKTLEYLFDYYMKEQQPNFKSQMKALVRRVITTGVGYVKVGFQRDLDRSPEVAAKISDVQAQLDYIRRVASEAAEGDIEKDDPQIEELMLSLQALMNEPMIILREGLVFDFPEADSIIIDPMCRQLRGFVGAAWVAHKLYLSADEVKEIYGVDVKNEYSHTT